MEWQHPFTCIVSGPTKAGKTTWAIKFVQNAHHLINPKPQQIIWCYREWQPAYKQLGTIPNLELCESLPDLTQLKQTAHIPKLLILDDFMQSFGKSDDQLATIFTRGSHHAGISCIHLTQNLFHGSRTARINAHYIVVMKNPGDKLQIQNLGRQIFPGQQKYFLESYEDATRTKFGYILLDISPQTNDQFRL